MYSLFSALNCISVQLYLSYLVTTDCCIVSF